MSKSRFLPAFAISLSAFLSAADAANTKLIVQASRKFNPTDVTIGVGESLNIINRDDFTHEIYINSGAMNFESDEQSPGQTVTVTFPALGTFTVRCHIHPRMSLAVHVK